MAHVNSPSVNLSEDAKQDNTSLSGVLNNLASQYADIAQKILGSNLISVVLFGSVARGKVHSASDIDLLVICRTLPRGAFCRRQLLEPIRNQLQDTLDQLWAKGIYTDFVEVIRTDVEADQRHLLYLDMTEEAVLLFDRDRFFAGVMAQMRQRLKTLGARRKQLGKTTYWDLKPDFQPGEVIEL